LLLLALVFKLLSNGIDMLIGHGGHLVPRGKFKHFAFKFQCQVVGRHGELLHDGRAQGKEVFALKLQIVRLKRPDK
jgi:hypothetical protein